LTLDFVGGKKKKRVPSTERMPPPTASGKGEERGGEVRGDDVRHFLRGVAEGRGGGKRQKERLLFPSLL